MHFLIGAVVIAGAIWLAIEFPKFRKALLIMGVGFAVFCAWVAWFLTSKPS
jgi:hypothetical protein